MNPVPFWVKPAAGLAPQGRIEAPKAPSPLRLEYLKKTAEYAAKQYKSVGLKAPRIEIEGGKFRLLYGSSSPDGSAAFHSPGFEDTTVNFLKAGGMAVDAWPYQIFIGEKDSFDTAESRIYPERSRATIAHELFHAVHKNYPVGASGGGRTKWVTEGLPDALGLWAVTGLDGFNPITRFKGGQREFGKALGLRPWDMPLELSEFTAAPLWYEKGIKDRYGVGDKRTLAGYQTSAFWRFVFVHSRKPEHAWRGLHQMLNNPPPEGGDANKALLRWTDRGIRNFVAAHPHGLSHALSAFIPYLVEFPDQVVESRSGIYRHPEWLDTLFSNGCPRHVITPEKAVAPITLDVKRRAAQCVRIAWPGDRFRDSGWPAAAITAVASDGSEAGARAIHLGVNGKRAGFTSIAPDKDSGRWVKSWIPVEIDPLNPRHTENEAVLTFTNVAHSEDPDKTINRSYEIHIGFNAAKAEGTVTQPAEPEASPPRPATTGKAAGVRKVSPALPQSSREEEGISVDAGSALQALAPLADCTNGSLKLGGSVGGMNIERHRQTPAPGLLSAACNEMTRLMQNPAALANAARGQLNVSLDLPIVPTGTTGAVSGARARVDWSDPALQASGDSEVGAETELVSVTITQATESFVRGRFTARFTQELHGVAGTVNGEFLTWRSNADSMAPPESLFDFVSSDFLLAAAYAGMDVKAMEKMAAAAQAEANAEGLAGRSQSGGSHRGGGGGIGNATPAPDCNCSSNEFFSKQREDCAPRCGNYASVAMSYVRDRELTRGKSREAVEAELNACPANCAALTPGAALTSVCADAIYPLRRLCAAAPKGEGSAAVNCYLDYLVRELEEPMKSQFRKTNADQIAAMDAETRKLFVGAMLDGLKSEGVNCPAP